MPTRSHLRALAASVAPLTLALAPAIAGAAPPWLELRWPTVAGCPGPAEVEARILRLTAGASPARVTATATIDGVPGGLRLDLRVEDAGGAQRRILESPRCDALADGAALIVAVAADPLAVAGTIDAVTGAPDAPDAPDAPAPAPEPPPGSPTPGADRGPPPVDLEVESLPVAPPPIDAADTDAGDLAPRRRAGPSLGLSLGTAAGIGPTRRFAPGIRGGLALLWPRARAELRGSYWFPSPLRYPGAPDLGADLRLAAGSVRGGPRLRRGPLAFALTGGVELGALLARGVGFAANSESRGLWAAAVVAGDLQWTPLRWPRQLGLEIEAFAAFTRRQYTAADAQTLLYTVLPLSNCLGGGVTLIFF
ncbi:MAG: hypothetical protein R3B09_13775 [Nannocystaceae bacterium]